MENKKNTRTHNFKEIYKSDTKKKTKNNIMLLILLSTSLILSLIYIIYNILNIGNIINYGYTIINSVFILIINICFIFTYVKNKDSSKKTVFTISSLIMNLYLIFILLTTFNLVKLPTLTTMEDFKGKNISEALKWGEENNIDIIQIYDNSDDVKQYHVISQNVNPNTVLNNIKEVELTISKGPDYNKDFILENLIGKNIDDAVKYIDENHLSNVIINYEINKDIERDIIFKQNISGNIKRNSKLELTVSYGETDDFGEINMIDLIGLSKFKATLFLKRNALNYKEEYDFSDKYDKNYIMNQNVKVNEKVTKDSNIIIGVSKGSKIKVPDITSMTQSEVTNWVIENNLKINFIEKYDLDVKIGNIINSDYKKGDVIEEGSTITVTISKGQLKFGKFNSVMEFKTWADNNFIKYTENYVTSKDIKKGDIINFSVNEGDILNPYENIVITISQGDTTTIPNFIGKSKTEIAKLCSSYNLTCTYYYVGYTSQNKDIATKQSKNAGLEVIEGTSVSIGLSSGIYTSNPNIDTTPPPTVTKPDNCEMKKIILAGTESVDLTKLMIQNQNKDFKFNFIVGYPGYGTTGSIYKESNDKYHNKEFSTCETITIKIIQK